VLELLPYIISGFALLVAVMPAFGFERGPLVVVLVALGSGQIHAAVAALALFLVFANRWRLSPGLTLATYGWAGALLAGIVVTTILAPESSRTFVELAQLVLYLLILMLMLSYLNSGERLLWFLQGGAVAAAIVGGMALALYVTGQVAPPSIFVGRGSNEGAEFLSLTGTVFAAVMFVRTRNPLYLLGAIFLIYLQNLATSRGSVAVSATAVLLALFFMFHNRLIRAGLVVAGLYVLVTNVPLLNGLYQSQLNFSGRERMALLNDGIWFWQQRPLLGWGWGSTTDLAERAPTTQLVYPHFHNSYVQLLVEAGVVGAAMLATFLYFGISRIVIAFSRIRQPGVTMLTASAFVAITISGLFDSMLYGADRAVQVVILMALSARAVALAAASPTADEEPAPEIRLLGTAATP